MRHSAKRWMALLLALVMAAGLLPGFTLSAAAQTQLMGTLDHTDVISLPVTIRNHSADGMLFEWDGIGTGSQGGGEYEFKPFRNPYNTSNVTEPIPYVGVNPAVGQLFCNDWDLRPSKLATPVNGLSYHYGETYDSRYAHIETGDGWHEYPVWDTQVNNPLDTRYMVIRFRTPGFGSDQLFIKRYTDDTNYKQAGVLLSTGNAYGAYKLVGTEDGWTTIAVDLNDSSVQKPNDHDGTPASAVKKISIGFNGAHELEISFIAFFIRLEHDGVSSYSGSFRYCGYDFINQDYCFRMDDPNITMVEPRPAIGLNLLLDWASEDLSVAGTGASLTGHASSSTAPEADWNKYVTVSAGSGPATATLWSDSSPAPAGRARYAALRCKADFNAELTILANGSEVVTSFNPATVTEGGDVLDVQTDTTTENGVTVSWKTVIIDTHYAGAVSSMAVQIPAGKSLDLAYAGLFRDYDPSFTSGYNYATDARVFVFEDYSYRHDRAAYYTPIEQYRVYRDGSVIHFQDRNGGNFDPTVMLNVEHDFTIGGAALSSYSPVNGTVELLEDASGRYLRFSDTGNDRGIGLHAVLMDSLGQGGNGVSAGQVQYAVVSYRVASRGSAQGETLPMYVMLDTAAGGFDPNTVTLGFFDAVADNAWHVDVLDLSECVSRAPNGETFSYKHDTFQANANAVVRRIGLADGWGIYGAQLDLAYLAFFPTATMAEQYGNAYSEAYKSIPVFPTGSAAARQFSVITNAFTAEKGHQLNDGLVTGSDAWENSAGEKRFRVGSNNGFELLDPDYCILEGNNYYRDEVHDGVHLPNYYPDRGLGDWVRNDSSYTNYNVNGSTYSYYNDVNIRDIASTNGASGIYASSDDTYGYIMGLTERQLADGQLRYRQEVVEYLAQLLQKALNVPRTFLWYNIQFYSSNYVQGDVDGERFGYYDERLEDGSENVNAMFPRDYAGWLRYKLGVTARDGSLTGSTGNLGSYSDTLNRSAALLSSEEGAGKGMDAIATWTDAAYFMLNTLFLETAGSHTMPEYKYLQLVRETPAGGRSGEDSYYVFDTRYTNVMFDFEKGVIGNNSPNVSPDVSIADTTNGQVATYAFLPILRELPEFQSTFPYLKDTGIADKNDGADSYYNRDYNFTLECHGTFTYYAEKDLFFQFDGDDDVYLYVDGRCVLDLGGAHRPANQLIRINEYIERGVLDLADGQDYTFDFYFMERHGTGSNLRIMTNMEVYSDNIATEKQAFQGTDGAGNPIELPDYSMADFTQPVSYSFSVTNNFDPLGRLTNFSFKDSDVGFYAGFDKLELGELAPGVPRSLSELSVTVTDSSGSPVFGPQTPANENQLKLMLTDPGGRGGLAYGETITLSGVLYVIGESHSAFSNTVISRAGKHSGVAYHHLLSNTSSTHYYAWKGHELSIPIAEILEGKDSTDTGSWADFYRCNDDLNALNTSEVTVDRSAGVVRVSYNSTGTRRLNFTSTNTSLSSPYPISVDVHVLDMADSVYVLDFDGSVRLGRDSEYSFAQNDVTALPGVATKLRYEAFTDLAPDYGNNRLTLGGQLDLWPKEPGEEPPEPPTPTNYTLTVSLGSSMSASGGALSQTLEAGSAITPITVTPSDPMKVIPAPSITGNTVTAAFTPAERIYFFNLRAVSWWESGCDHYAYFFGDGDAWVKLVKVNNNGIWACQMPNKNYTALILVRTPTNQTPSFSNKYNQTGDIYLQQGKNYVSSFSENGGGSWSTYSQNPFGSWTLSGRLDSDVQVVFANAAAPAGAPAEPAAFADPGLPAADDEIVLVEAPYYYKENERVTVIPAGGLVYDNNGQGEFTVELPAEDSDELPLLNFRPDGIMDGAAQIWLTARVWEDKTGVEPGAYLGNVDPRKEVEMFQAVVVVPANVVYYEDSNSGINFHSQDDSAEPTVTWTHVLNDGTGTQDFVDSPGQSADQSSPYGYELGYADGEGRHYSGGSATRISFRGSVTLADFDFQGTGFDLISRCREDGPTVVARVYTPSADPNHDYSGDEPVRTVYVITEFSNYNSGLSGEAMYQVPVLSVHDLAWGRYHVVLDGMGRVDMTNWSIVKEGDDYYMVSKLDAAEKWKILTQYSPVRYEKDGVETSLNPASVETEFWLDGLRVYGALNGADQNVYYNPGEANASFTELRDLLTAGKAIAVNYTQGTTDFSNGSFTSTVELRNEPSENFPLNDSADADLSCYFLVGPNNELYLNGSGDKLQAAVFSLVPEGSAARTFQVAAKLLDTTSFGNAGSSSDLRYLTTAGWRELGTVRSGTELYFELDPTLCPQLDGAFTVILGVGTGNEASSMVSLTKVKAKGWSFRKAFSDEMNFIYDNGDPETGRIIGVTQTGSAQLGNIIRLLTAVQQAKPPHPFRDVPAEAWYADAVTWAYENGITAGVSADSFGPGLACTRAQIVTFLWKAAGAPEPAQALSFADVPTDSWYAKAVAWACENGITAGTSPSSFSPNALCTRAQAAAFLWRWAGSPESAFDCGFADVASDAWYATAVRWAAEHGVTAGTSPTSFSPGRSCSRAEIVTFLYRCAESINGGEQQ